MLGVRVVRTSRHLNRPREQTLHLGEPSAAIVDQTVDQIVEVTRGGLATFEEKKNLVTRAFALR